MEHIKEKFERYQRDNKNNSQSKTDNTRRKDEQTNNDQQITTQKTKYRVTRIPLSTEIKSDVREE